MSDSSFLLLHRQFFLACQNEHSQQTIKKCNENFIVGGSPNNATGAGILPIFCALVISMTVYFYEFISADKDRKVILSETYNCPAYSFQTRSDSHLGKF